jgi:hypothetical protein
MAAATGASLRELMERMGHTNTRAAMIYQHATRERDEAIAAAGGGARLGPAEGCCQEPIARIGHDGRGLFVACA